MTWQKICIYTFFKLYLYIITYVKYGLHKNTEQFCIKLSPKFYTMFSLIELFVSSVLPYLYLIIECVLYRKNIFESQNLFKVGIGSYASSLAWRCCCRVERWQRKQTLIGRGRYCGVSGQGVQSLSSSKAVKCFCSLGNLFSPFL